MASRLLAVATSSTLSFCELEKDGNIAVKSTATLGESPLQHGVIWEADDAGGLLVATRTGIVRYDEAGKAVKKLLESSSVKAFIRRPRSRQIYICESQRLIRLDATKSTTLVEGDFCGGVSSLAISPDGGLIACLSTPLWIFDTKSSSRIRLDGIHFGSVTSCAFSLHVPGRLFVGISNGDLLVYDVLKDTYPTKRIAVGGGSILAIAACPATTARVATADGTGKVTLLDIEKDKPVRKFWNVQQTLTSIIYHPSGSSLYVGTDDGKIFSCSLRQINEEPRQFSLGKSLNAILSLALQNKPQNPISRAASKVSLSPKALSRPPLADESNKPKPSVSPSQRSRVTSNSKDLKPSTSKSPPAKVVPPVPKIKSPLAGKKPKSSAVSVSTATGSPPPRTKLSATIVAGSRLTSISSEASNLLALPRASSRASSISSAVSRESSRTSSTKSRVTDVTAHPSPPSMATGSSSTYSGLTYSPSLPSMDADMTVQNPLDSRKPFFSRDSVSPVPSVVAAVAPPAEPVPVVLPPETVVHKRVVWEDAAPQPQKNDRQKPESAEEIFQRTAGRETDSNGASSSSTIGLASTEALKSLTSQGKALSLDEDLNDVLYDLRQEVKSDIMGLHLDLVRMGRSWKTELRNAIQEHLGTITDLREENARLRLENEKLKRGL